MTQALKLFFLSFRVIFTLALPFQYLHSQPNSVNEPEYKLVWSDEFNHDGRPNPKNWTYEEGFVRNEELQWYDKNNAIVQNGNLVITAKKVHRPNPNYKEGSSNWIQNRKTVKYSSACLITKGLHQWKYGRFEVRARIPTAQGMWPAIWFLGVEGEWPCNGEIDLMEYYKGKILGNFFWGTEKRWNPVIHSKTKNIASYDPDWPNRFHTWRMDWTEKHIELYVDDVLLNKVDLDYIVNPNTKFGPKSPFRQPHYLLINLAVGGKAAGDPGNTKFPQRYVIDYVRVYQK